MGPFCNLLSSHPPLMLWTAFGPAKPRRFGPPLGRGLWLWSTSAPVSRRPKPKHRSTGPTAVQSTRGPDQRRPKSQGVRAKCDPHPKVPAHKRTKTQVPLPKGSPNKSRGRCPKAVQSAGHPFKVHRGHGPKGVQNSRGPRPKGGRPKAQECRPKGRPSPKPRRAGPNAVTNPGAPARLSTALPARVRHPTGILCAGVELELRAAFVSHFGIKHLGRSMCVWHPDCCG